MLIQKEAWTPANGLELEANAIETVKSDSNILVVAGPGAGKTELLAQRACFLLQTNTCPYPQKILAISFKRDAASNLKERVKLRCGEELSRRFVSLTYDAFARQILTQFKNALPPEYKIFGEVNVADDVFILNEIKTKNIIFFNSNSKPFLSKFLVEAPLPVEITNNNDIIKKEVWKSLLNRGNSIMSYSMIMRLAEFIINSNPKIKKYLQLTYKQVFLDEFQDTTSIQYSFLRSCFDDSNAVFTAVGDDKQRIMIWAGALPEIFSNFLNDKGAKLLPLKMNFRSAPKIVDLLNHLIKNLLHKDELVIASSKWSKDYGEAFVWIFENQKREAEFLAQTIKELITNQNISARDICILAKQQLPVYANDLIQALASQGIKARDESTLQEILNEELTIFLINTLNIIFKRKAAHENSEALKFLRNLNNSFTDRQLLVLDTEFAQLISNLRNTQKESNSKENLEHIIDSLISFAHIDKIKSVYPRLKGNEFKKLIHNFKTTLCSFFSETNDALLALNKLEGKDTIPVMTVHKSKGLEYHTVIFLGLEDKAFWTFKKQPDEDKCLFFVALSRAKERVIFTFSKTRKDQYDTERPQAINDISIIFEELENSGVVIMDEII